MRARRRCWVLDPRRTPAARLIKAVHHADCSCVYAEICGLPLTYKIGFSGAHWVMNSLAVLTAVQVLGGDLALAALALAGMRPLDGRGRRHYLPVADGMFTLIDESYNANPGVHAGGAAQSFRTDDRRPRPQDRGAGRYGRTGRGRRSAIIANWRR